MRIAKFHLGDAGSACAIALIAVLLAGAGPAGKLEKEVTPKVEETVGDIAYVRRSEDIRVEGVGLVVGLKGTGSNPEPSAWRSQLLDRMRKAQVPDPEGWLESVNTSLVLVRGVIPAGITTKDRFDIEALLTPASTTTSLEGGFLISTELKVVQMVDGKAIDGQVMAEVFGPIMTGTKTQPESLKVGRILGGARAKRDLPYQLVLKPERQGYRTVTLLQNVINSRFYSRKGIEQVGMAEAKRPELMVLNVPQNYHHNQLRYFQVVERLPIVDNSLLRAQRQEKWSRELLDPKTTGEAALRLEGIGRNASAALRQGLTSTNEQVRFFSAEALAYLNDASGADTLAEAAIRNPSFRAHALAALAAMDQPASVLRLRELLAQADPQVRYGAFNALRTLDEHDPALGRVVLHRNTESNTDSSGEDMALQIRKVQVRESRRVEDQFALYVVDCDGPPMVHLLGKQRCEIVVFGGRQKLLAPVVLGGAGPLLLNATLDDTSIQISRIGTGAEDLRVESPSQLGELIRRLAEIGATYPEVVDILRAAQVQKNLEGPLVEDAMPTPLNSYDKAQLAGMDASAKADADVQRAGSESEEKSEKKDGFLKRFRGRFDRK